MRVLLIGDGIALSTGFAQVLRHCAEALVARGHEVAQIASLDNPPDCRSEPYADLGVIPFFPSGDIGYSILAEVLRKFQPDRILLNSDPGTALNWHLRLQAFGNQAPILLYAPVEGAPVARQFCEAFNGQRGNTVLYTEWAADRVEEQCGVRYPWVWHGVDPQVWHPLPPADRTRMREVLGWTDHFVIAYVGRNSKRKSQDVLIEAMAQVKRTAPDTLLYLHCARFDGYWGNGWDLDWLVQQHRVEDVVEFPSSLDGATRGEPALPLARKLACADLYVHAAQVEGFGLPLLEAMASGLPVVHVADGGNMDEVIGTGGFARLDPYRFESWFTGGLLALTLPDQWAQAIYVAQQHPDALAEAGRQGLARSAAFDWGVMTDRLVAACEAGEPVPVEVSV